MDFRGLDVFLKVLLKVTLQARLGIENPTRAADSVVCLDAEAAGVEWYNAVHSQ